MALRNGKPITHRPVGLSDATDGSNAFQGAMSILADLVPAPDTKDAWVPRPAAIKLTDFPGFTNPGFISAQLVVGDIVYGMIATDRNPGHDEPFSYNLKTDTFNTVAGVTNGNTPISPVTSGAWVPPIMCVVGNRVIVTHMGFPGAAVKFGWFDLSSFSSTTLTGDVANGSHTILNISSNALQAGWQPGQTITGAGIPPNTTLVSIAMDGLSAVMSAAATAPGTGEALTVAGGTAAAPLWGAGDTNVVNLPNVPNGVAQMNGRAFYLLGKNGVALSDSLLPCNITNASQFITFANGVAATAIGGLPLVSTVVGGVIQAIVVFQGVTAIQQITGDPALSTLQVNALKSNTGTLAPLSVAPTTKGLAFLSPEGLRVVDFSATVSDPIGDAGQGVSVPFINAVEPSRMAGASNADTLRFATQNGNNEFEPFEEYWLDTARKVWCGPHTFPFSLAQPWGPSFVITPVDVLHSLWQSDAVPALTSLYVENNLPMQWQAQTILLPDNEVMAENAMVETAVTLSLPNIPAVNVLALVQDEQDAVLDQVNLSPIGAAPPLWGTIIWGSFIWSRANTHMTQYRVAWHEPIVFKQMSFALSGPSQNGVKVGNMYFRYQILGYLLE